MIHDGDGEALKQFAQRRSGWPIIRTVQGWVGWDFEQPDLVLSLLMTEGLETG